MKNIIVLLIYWSALIWKYSNEFSSSILNSTKCGDNLLKYSKLKINLDFFIGLIPRWIPLVSSKMVVPKFELATVLSSGEINLKSWSSSKTLKVLYFVEL